ncbi:MAG: hypothetical protein H7Y01_02275, partial [Ferruginibacter sp.]|nr:hypothetical protein [Chitinophagaceae bacterium]
RYNSHNQTGLLYLEACYKSGKAELEEKIRLSLHKDLEQQQQYYNYIRDSRPEFYGGFERSEAPINEIMLEVLSLIEKKYAPQVQTKTTTEGPTTITNSLKPDSGQKIDNGGLKIDSGKKPN